tara:strand:+ start:354 stop:863 length:510 start_codon:yes stop_codon:yes gene_type:complete
MKTLFRNISILFILISVQSVYAQAVILDGGWLATTEQTDPFDSSKIKMVSIQKRGINTRSNFLFNCEKLSMEVRNKYTTASSFSLDGREIQYKIDGGEPVKKNGTTSSFAFGLSINYPSRYFSFELNDLDITSLKEGKTLMVAGEEYGSWEKRTFDLDGFKDLYNKMCD